MKVDSSPLASSLPGAFNTGPKFFMALLTLTLIIGLGVSTVYRATYSKVHRSDFTVYMAAARAVREGTSLYEAHNVRGWYYMYLPIFAIAMEPFERLPIFWASLLWYALSVLMMGHAFQVSVRVARRFFPRGALEEPWLYTGALLLLLGPLISGIARGQASVLLSYLVTLSVGLFLQRRAWLAGLCLAGGIILQVFPALLLVYFAVKRRWEIVAITAVWLAVGVWVIPSIVFGVRGNQVLLRQWWSTIALPVNTPGQATNNIRYEQMMDPGIAHNQSLQAVLLRGVAGWTTAGGGVPAPERWAERLAQSINIGFLLISFWACRGGRADPLERRTLLQICVVLLLMLFLSPVSWSHNYTVALLPLTVGLAAWDPGSAARRSLRFSAGLLGYFIGISLALMVRSLLVLGALLWGTVALWLAFVSVLGHESDPREAV